MVRFRALWHRAHRLLGLLTGLFIVFLGVTGSILVFDHAFDEMLNPGLLTTEGPAGERRSYEEILKAAQVAHPEFTITGVTSPRTATTVHEVWFESGDGQYGSIYVDPFTAVVRGHRFGGTYLMSFLYDLHYSFSAGETGQTIVGVLGLAYLGLMVTGLYLWYPRGGKWRMALTFKKGASIHRQRVDLHRTVGFYTAPILLVVAFSGISMNLPNLFESGVEVVSALTPPPRPRKLPEGTTRSLSADKIIEIGQESSGPTATFSFVAFDSPDSSSWVLAFKDPAEPRRTSGFNRIEIDTTSGAVLGRRMWGHSSRGDRFVAWQFPLHNGEAFGLPGRYIVFASGFCPLILFFTGLLLWRKKSRGKTARAPR